MGEARRPAESSPMFLERGGTVLWRAAQRAAWVDAEKRLAVRRGSATFGPAARGFPTGSVQELGPPAVL